MECQGTVKPADVNDEVDFDIKRDCWARVWDKLEDANEWGEPTDDSTPWTPDDPPSNSDEDLTPSESNHIYQIDAPGFTTKWRTGWDCLAYIGDFKEWVMVKIDGTWYQCSNYYKWHSKLYTEPKNETEMTRAAWDLQQLGGGWIIVSDSP